MGQSNWAEIALRSEIEYSRALGSVPTEYPDYVHLYNESVPWGGDFNCAIGVRLTDLPSFDRVVEQVERIHRGKRLNRPDRYDVYPPALDEALWRNPLAQRGYRLQRSIWFTAETLAGGLPAACDLYTPGEAEYMAWYHERQKAQDWYDTADFERARPLQAGFARVYRPYWLLRDGVRVGWVYCGPFGPCGSLFDVWIEPAYRRQGLGRVLMNAIRREGWKRGIRHLLVRTSESRRGLYEKCGFRECLQSSTIRRT